MKKTLALFMLSFAFLTQGAYAITELDNAVEESEKQKSSDEKTHTTVVRETDSQKNSIERDAENALFNLICFCWFINQCDTRYDHYPYEKGNWYIENSFTADKETYYDEPQDMPEKKRLWRFSLNTALLAYPKLGYGNETKFESMVCPFIGLSCTNTILSDMDETSGIINIYGVFPVFQLNKLSMYLDFGWQRWYGDAHEILRDDAFLFGLEFKSYPFNPLVLEYQITWQYASDNTSLQQMKIHAGFMSLKNKEFYGEYKRIAVVHESNAKDSYTVKNWNGLALGARIYF